MAGQSNPFDQFDATPAPRGQVFTLPKDPVKVQHDTLEVQALSDRIAKERAGGDPPSGYARGPGGTLVPIPGGPADKPRFHAMREGDAKALEDQVQTYANLKDSIGGFRPDYGGNTVTGELENTAQGLLGTGTPGQRDWWAGLRNTDNLIRNKMYGASLTAGEKQAYDQTTVNPRMNSDQIQKNLTRRLEIIREAMTRHVGRLKAAGYNPEEIDAATGEYGADLTPGRKKDDKAAVGNTNAPPSDGAPPLAPPPGPQVNKSTMYYGQPGGHSTVATGATASGPDAEANAMVDQMFRAGAKASDINAKLVQMGRRPLDPMSFDKSRAWQQAHPDYKGGFANMVLDRPTTAGERQSATPFDSGITSAANELTFGNLDSLSGDPEKKRADLSAMYGLNPIASNIGGFAGALGASAGLEAGAAKLAGRLGASAIPWARRGADAAYGAASGAGANDGNRLNGALLGAVAGAGGGVVGRGATRAAGGVLTGVRDAAVQSLSSRGIPLTVGQVVSQSGIFGKAAKGMEDRLSGIPVIGDMVNARRLDGLRGLNRAGFNEGLAPIGESTNGVTGAPGIDLAQEGTDRGYRAALDGVNVQADVPYDAQWQATLARGAGLPEPMAGNAAYTLNTRVANSFDPAGNLSGNNFQQSLRGLQQDASKVRSLPYGNDFGDVAAQAKASLEGLLNRQAPDVLPKYQAANTAFRNEEILRDAVDKAKNQPEELWTAAQLAQSASANARKYGNTQGTTQQPFYELTRAAQDILPNKVPDSGTAGRLAMLALPGMLGGAGSGIGYAGGDAESGGAAGLGLGALLALGGTKAAQKILVNSFLKRPSAAIRIGNQVNRLAPVGGLFGASGSTAFLPTGQ